MNRLQKKCLIATAGLHLLLILILLVGPGFFAAKPKPDDTQVLEVIPTTLVDAAVRSGVRSAPVPAPQPPQPERVVTPSPAPDPRPVTKPAIVKAPEPEPVKPPEKLTPDDLRPVDRTPTKPPEHKINVDLSQVVHTVPKNTDSAAADAKEQRRLRDLRAKAFKSALTSIKANASSATTVELPGESSVSYANYSAVVKSIYDQAWTAPDDTASDDADTRVSVTIGRDGTVIGAHILTPSGDASVDRSVQRALDRVTFVAPFPDGATEKERNFIINFNLKAKRMLG